MNCPNCHCPRGEPLTVAVNSLVTRCHHAFHAVATAEAPPLNEPLHPQSPVTPDDFAQQKPTQDASDASNGLRSCVHLFDQAVVGGPCLVCGARPWVDRRDPDQPSTQPLGTVLVADSNPPERLGSFALIKPPYTTPVPTLHDGSTGWVYCEACDAPQPVAGHECATSRREPLSFLVEAAKQQERAEFAENLLMAMAFDHQRSNFVGIADFYLCLPLNSCALCTAARGGGR